MTGSAWAGRLLGIAVVCASAVVSGRARTVDTVAGLFDQYLHGDADSAVAALAAWPESRREAESGISPVTGDPWSDAAFALFHTEVGFRTGKFGRHRLGDVLGPPEKTAEVHFRTSYQLIDRIAAGARDRGEERLLSFAKSWCIVSASWTLRMNWHGASTLFDDLVRRRFSDDAELLLLRASIEEPRIGPYVEEKDGYHFIDVYGTGPAANGVVVQGPRIRSSSHGHFNYNRTADMERDLQRALAKDPLLVEARLRLGRHLILMDQDAQGVAALEQTVIDARAASHTFAGYLAALFAGDWYERHGQRPKAADAYRAASVFLPRAPAARLALGRLDILSGQADLGWAGIRSIFGDDAAAGETAVDPWVDYLSAQAWQIRPRLASLRASLGISESKALAATERPAASVPRVTRLANQTDAQATGASARQFRAAVDGVRVDVYVTDGGKPVTGLSAADFEIRDNNVVQRIDSAAGVGNLSVAIVLDLSSSVTPEDLDQSRRAGQAVAAALRPGDVASVLTFDEKIALRIRSSSSTRDVQNAILGARQYPSYSVLWDATIAGAAFAVETPGRPVVIALTDLADNASWLTDSPQTRSPRDNRTALVDVMRRTGVMLDVFARQDIFTRRAQDRQAPPSDALGHIWDAAAGSLAGQEIAEMTGGEFFPSTQPGFPARIATHFDDLRSGYVLTFMPTGVKPDDGWHKITVRLKQGKGKVSARPGYYTNDVKRGR